MSLQTACKVNLFSSDGQKNIQLTCSGSQKLFLCSVNRGKAGLTLICGEQHTKSRKNYKEL